MSNVRKQIFFTSDWHCFHENVLKFCNRPFTDLDHMHRVLINNYNASVPDHGICYFVGDMGMKNSNRLKAILDQLNGTKILILGNHDAKINTLYKAGFDAVCHGMKLEIAKQMVTISHCPLLDTPREDTTRMKKSYDPNWHGNDREKHRKHSFSNTGQFHLHGHIHSPNKGQSKKTLGKQFDVGVDASNYRPVHISQIESWIALYKEEE